MPFQNRMMTLLAFLQAQNCSCASMRRSRRTNVAAGNCREPPRWHYDPTRQAALALGAQRIERRPRNSWWRVVRDRRHGAHLHHRQQPLPDATSAEAVEVKAERSVTRSYPTGGRGREMSGDDHHRAVGEGLEETPACRARHSASTQKQLLSWGSAHCSGVCMISPLSTMDACGDPTTRQTWPGVWPGHGSIRTLSSKA